MAIRIENHCQTSIPFDIEKLIKKLLKTVPGEHLIGLDAIIIVDRVTHKQSRGAGGVYWQKWDQQRAAIEIAVADIYRGMPRFLFFFPFITEFMFASVLYHEIGHHYEHFTHGVTKKQRENFAEKYATKMLTRAFFWWRLLLLPLAPVIRGLNRKMNFPGGKGG